MSRREIREALRVPDSTVRRWLQDLVDFEYLALVQTDGEKNGQGKTVRYRLLDREPQENELGGLLSPRELGALLGRRRDRGPTSPLRQPAKQAMADLSP